MNNRLSSRELEILVYVAEGLSNKIIASRLLPVVQEATIKNHMTRILLKLGASDRTHAVVIAHCSGRLELPCLGQRFVDAAKSHIVDLLEEEIRGTLHANFN